MRTLKGGEVAAGHPLPHPRLHPISSCCPPAGGGGGLGTHCMAGFLPQMEAEELLNLSHPLLLQLCPCVRAPGLALRFSSGASAARASWTRRASAVPGPRPGCWPPAPGPGAAGPGPLCPASRSRHFSRPSAPQSGRCQGLMTPGAENEAPPTAQEASFERLMVTGEGTKGRCASPPP